MDSPGIPPSAEAGTVWLSGAILTLLNKLVFPVLWLGALVGLVVWVFAKTRHIAIAPGFRFLVALTLVATGLLLWWTVRLQRVGYRGGELIVSNYRRAAHIPFAQVEAVEPVWWYRGRMVRIRLRGQTPFGSTVYYLPKWGRSGACMPRLTKTCGGLFPITAVERGSAGTGNPVGENAR